MIVTLEDYTGKGSGDPMYAADLLIFAKNTRINMSPNGLEEIKKWPMEKKMAELEYAANTIPSSWEFVNYTFYLGGVTRAFSHQCVRTRTAAFAQQTMQILDMSKGPGWQYATGPSVEESPNRKTTYTHAMRVIAAAYSRLIEEGASIEDARGVLPTNILTNMVARYDLRSLVGVLQTRLSPRNLGEFRDVALLMKERVLEVHPWAALFIDRTFDKAAADLDREIKALRDAVPGLKDAATRMHKLVDSMRRKSVDG